MLTGTVYLCKLIHVEKAVTQHGDDMWKLRFKVVEDPYQGRFIFDNMVFSDAAIKRAKFICSRLGLDVSGELDLAPDLIRGQSCFITVETEEYEDRDGNTKKRNTVPFAGYERADATDVKTLVTGDSGGTEDDSEKDLPF